MHASLVLCAHLHAYFPCIGYPSPRHDKPFHSFFVIEKLVTHPPTSSAQILIHLAELAQLKTSKNVVNFGYCRRLIVLSFCRPLCSRSFIPYSDSTGFFFFHSHGLPEWFAFRPLAMCTSFSYFRTVSFHGGGHFNRTKCCSFFVFQVGHAESMCALLIFAIFTVFTPKKICRLHQNSVIRR